MPRGATGRERVNFTRKAEAEKFLKAAKKEFRRTKKVSFLTSSRRLFDAIGALQLLEGIGGTWPLRRAANLYRLMHETHEKRVAKPFTEPESRVLELQPSLFKAVRRLALEKGVDMGDLVAGIVWQFVKAESEKKIPVVKNEGKIPLRFLL